METIPPRPKLNKVRVLAPGRPHLAPSFPNIHPLWTDPVTGISIPKDPCKNLQWRSVLLQKAEEDSGLRRDLYTACSLSLLFWINTFCFTYRKFRIGDDGHQIQCSTADETHLPFVTWQIQDDHILEVERAVKDGYDLLTDKSRDMGATWDHIVVYHHQWLFQEDRSFLELSRKEDCVDQLGHSGEAGSDPGTLLGKHDYINRFLPSWMLPSYERKRMHLINLVNRSRIDGESTNSTAGSSDRRTSILLDEMAKMPEGEAIKRSTKDVTACRLVNSTPDGPGTEYSKWRLSGQIKVFVMPWWEHPEKGKNRYTKQNPITGKWTIRSPFYDHEDEVRSPREMAIELDMDHVGSGATFFELYNIEVAKSLFGRDPRSRWSIDFEPSVPEEAIRKIVKTRDRNRIRIRHDPKGPLILWSGLIHGRLDQTKHYVIGSDISKGQGASNSASSIFCVEDQEKVGEWADANTPPYEFARQMTALALWVGGAGQCRMPLLIWEAQGPGWDYGRLIVKVYEYPLYYRDRSIGDTAATVSKKYGWHSTRDKKEEMLGILRRCYAHGGFTNHSVKALDEAASYIYYANGGIGPACLMEESSEAKKTHGDRVIADGLSKLGSMEVHVSTSTAVKAPPRSIGYRMKKWRERRKAERANRNRRFNFSGRE